MRNKDLSGDFDNELKRRYKSEMDSVAFSSDFIARTVSALKIEAQNEQNYNEADLTEHKPVHFSKIRVIRTALISAAACFVCIFAIRVVSDERNRPDIQQENITTTTTTATTTTPQIIEEIADFTPFAAAPQSPEDALEPSEGDETMFYDTNPALSVTSVTYDNNKNTTTIIVTGSSATEPTPTITTSVTVPAKTEKETPAGDGSSADGGVSGNTTTDNADKGGDMTGRNAWEETAVGEGTPSDDAAEAAVEEEPGGEAGDSAEEAVEEDAAEEETEAESADDSEDGDEALVSPVSDDGNTLSLSGFAFLSGYTGSITFIPEDSSAPLLSTPVSSLAAALHGTLGSEIKNDGTPAASLSHENLEFWFEFSSQNDSFTVSLYKNAVTISYNDPDGNDYAITCTITAAQHDAIFKVFFIEAFSEHEYELFLARESGK